MCSSKVSGMDAKKKKKQHDNAPAVASVLKTRVIKKEFKKKKNQTHPSPSKWIFVSLHRGSTMPIEQLLLEK